ncbi:MAG: stage II sporulation protein R [Clostridia bacterium]|nr:stage II sporulation protein R [Clostridia bacterium]
MKKILIASLIFLLLVTVYTGWELAADAAQIYDGTIRLHVLAASDSEEDQALKLTVRDALLSEIAEWTAGVTDKESGEAILRERLTELEKIAEDALEKAGHPCDVTATLTTEYYPTREYEGVRLPAGEYTSLQVKIGAAEGKNWWCVLFPNLCTSTANAEEAMAETGFSKSQIRLLTEDEDPRYTIRFRIVEGFAKLGRTLKELFR